jgi:hypothetical protein
MNDAEGSTQIVLRDVRDERGTRHLAARRREDGSIVGLEDPPLASRGG